MSSFLKLITSKSGAITVLSAAVLTGASAYFLSNYIIGATTGNFTFPLIGTVSSYTGIAIYMAVGALVGEAANQYILPMLPQSTFVYGAEKIVSPLIIGAAAYGTIMLLDPTAASNLGGPVPVILTGALSSFLGKTIAEVWKPYLQMYIG